MADFFATGLKSNNVLDRFKEEMPEVARLIRLEEAQEDNSVNGSGSCIAVLDTGVRVTHDAFTGRIEQGLNFLSGQAVTPNQMTDANGHGTHVAGIAAASNWLDRAIDSRNLSGVAPGASIFPVKVLDNGGGTDLDVLEAAFSWLNTHAKSKGISIVCMSITDKNNHQDIPASFSNSSLQSDIAGLAAQNIPVVAAAGNFFRTHSSQEGMGFPAILSIVISVGSVFDDHLGPMTYGADNSASCKITKPDQLTPYTQRLAADESSEYRTTIFAPGGIVTSVGNSSNADIRDDDGTSQATPVIAGVIALMQEAYSSWFKDEDKSPTSMTVSEIARFLRAGAVEITDADFGRDNVINTKKKYYRVDAVNSVSLASNYGQKVASEGA